MTMTMTVRDEITATDESQHHYKKLYTGTYSFSISLSYSWLKLILNYVPGYCQLLSDCLLYAYT